MKVSGSKLVALLVFLAVPLAAQVNDTYVIPAAANTPGLYGTRWMTSFSVFNPQPDYPLTVSVTYIPSADSTPGKSLEVTFTVPPNATALSDNILDDLYGVSGTGALLVATFPEDNPKVPNSVLARAFLVTSSTYNNSSTGTYSQTIPGVWAGLQNFNTDGISAIAHGVRNSDRLGWRSNIGAVNLGRSNVTLNVWIRDRDGRTIIKNAPLNIPPLSHRQVAMPAEVNGGSIEFQVDDPGKDAVVFPYVSTIDRLSGDPTYQTPTLLASAKVLFKMGLPAFADTTSIGTKIGLQQARVLRANSTSMGWVSVMQTPAGLRITR